MSFNIFVHSTASDATEVNDNFYHFAQEDLYPRGGVSLTTADATYNLGSSTAKWENLYFNNLYANSISSQEDSIWSLVVDQLFEGDAVGSGRIEITGLNGDVDKNYLIYINQLSSGTPIGTVQMYINQDSAANYSVQGIGTFTADVSGIKLEATYPGSPKNNHYMSRNAVSGDDRIIIDKQNVNDAAYIWNNATNITTIQLEHTNYNAAAYIYVQILRRK